jgi:restriction system protein
MATKYSYSKIISNNYLGTVKEIKGHSPEEVYYKAQDQLAKWEEQENRKRERDRITDLKVQAEFDTKEALEEITSYETLLQSTLDVDDKIDWEKLYQRDAFPEFFYKVEVPSLHYFLTVKHSVPKQNIFHKVFPALEAKRKSKEDIARNDYENALKDYEINKTVALEKYNIDKDDFYAKQEMHNKEIENFKSHFEQGNSTAIERYIRMVLEKSHYPSGIQKDFEVYFDEISGAAIIDYQMPNLDQLPKIIEYKFSPTKKMIQTLEMKDKDFASFYEQVIYQITLRTIHEVVESVYIPSFQSIVFNGWVQGINPASGNDFTSCIISVQTTKESFETINLSRVDPKECVRSLKGLVAGPLSQLAPVKPIMNINKSDRRFVESRDVLSEINSTQNLASMDWEDFEHLIRELFSKIFSKDGAEVNVTQASRDGGVDAIAFDPDPIRGGKYIIQAKRYNNVVGVSAVRDLYGTMINEGAVKGILVTTSYFGSDSREFVKDKPISLIDGSNLIHMFAEHGYKVRIDLKRP